MQSRHYSPIDDLILGLDMSLRTLLGTPIVTARPNPAKRLDEAELSDAERELSGRLMRINHAGEVAAQGLYQGQALTARRETVKAQMEQAALEENDHLDWCESRSRELGTHVSYLGPFWYTGSMAIGALAGLAGDKWSLGFVAETEKQVVKHLDEHLQRLPQNDAKSRAILEQMKADESHHATIALEAGAAELPFPVKRLMKLASMAMTKTAYFL